MNRGGLGGGDIRAEGMLYLYWALAAVLPAAAAMGVLALADALWGVGL